MGLVYYVFTKEGVYFVRYVRKIDRSREKTGSRLL